MLQPYSIERASLPPTCGCAEQLWEHSPVPSVTLHCIYYEQKMGSMWTCNCIYEHTCTCANLCMFFIICLYTVCVAVGDPVISRGGVGFPLTGLTLPHFCVSPKPGPGFPTSHVMVFLCSVSSV